MQEIGFLMWDSLDIKDGDYGLTGWFGDTCCPGTEQVIEKSLIKKQLTKPHFTPVTSSYCKFQQRKKGTFAIFTRENSKGQA